MNVCRTSWLEDAGQDADEFQSLWQTQWNLNLVHYAALVKSLTENHSTIPAVKGLVDNYTLAKELPAQALSWVFADPAAVYWNYAARNMVRRMANHEEITPADAPHLDRETDPLEAHLKDLGRFLVSAALVGRCAITVECRVQDGWLRLPGLGVGIRIDGATSVRVEVFGGAARTVRIESGMVFDVEGFLGPRETEYLSRDFMEVLPCVTAGNRTILLDPRDPYFRKGWVLKQSFPGSLMARELTNEDFPLWFTTLSETFAFLRDVWPEIASGISTALRTIVPVASPAPGRSISCAAPCFSGAIITSLDSPVYMAESLIHEFSHNVLYAVMDQYGILAADCPQDAAYYSPWRQDARPLAGVLHAVYVFERVAEYYFRFLLRNPGHTCRNRYSSIVARLQLGIQTLKKFAGFNEHGMAFLERLSAGIQKHQACGSAIITDSIASELAEHLSSWRDRYPTYFSPATSA